MAKLQTDYDPIDVEAIAAAYQDGLKDARNAFDVDLFAKAIEEGGTPEEILDRGWNTANFTFDDWITHTYYDRDDPRAREAFVSWQSGWKRGVLPMLREAIESHANRVRAQHVVFYLYDSPAEDEPVERFDSLEEALNELARVPVGSVKVGDANGPSQKIMRVKYAELSPSLYKLRDRTDQISLMAKFEKARAIASRNGWRRANPARRQLRSNPPWVTQTLARAFEDIEDSKIPKEWLPRLQTVGSRGEILTARAKEYGCGAYGCVLPTMDPKVVLKVTSDDTEAEFAAKLSTTLVVPICTRYFAAMKLDEKRDGRPITLLWREEAKDIGAMEGEADELVADQHEAAQHAFEMILAFKDGGVDADEMISYVDRWIAAVEAMRASSELEWLASGILRVYREQGIFFGDLHAGNLGKCMREGELRWTITDPGHISVLNSSDGEPARAQ